MNFETLKQQVAGFKGKLHDLTGTKTVLEEQRRAAAIGMAKGAPDAKANHRALITQIADVDAELEGTNAAMAEARRDLPAAARAARLQEIRQNNETIRTLVAQRDALLPKVNAAILNLRKAVQDCDDIGAEINALREAAGVGRHRQSNVGNLEPGSFHLRVGHLMRNHLRQFNALFDQSGVFTRTTFEEWRERDRDVCLGVEIPEAIAERAIDELDEEPVLVA